MCKVSNYDSNKINKGLFYIQNTFDLIAQNNLHEY